MDLSPITPAHYLALSAVLFAIGAAGVLARKNLFIVLMSLELMLNAANLALVTFSRVHGDMTGHLFVLFVVAIAAAEACVGLAIVIALYRLKESVDLDIFKSLKG
ncbi:MAG TPA: NADH-quinone oxidoreductase subunit NuoK [bacterium]|nr:NADH-quinone oxidoreductase subunit NuoK [bacterium]